MVDKLANLRVRKGCQEADGATALGYARERHAFGQPIAGFQAIQLKLADMATDIQAARLMTYWAAVRSEAGPVRSEAAMAKYFASETALRTTMEAMRIHLSQEDLRAIDAVSPPGDNVSPYYEADFGPSQFR